jgi:hypothetical protein
MTQNGVLKDRKWVLKISHDKYKPCEHRHSVTAIKLKIYRRGNPVWLLLFTGLAQGTAPSFCLNLIAASHTVGYVAINPRKLIPIFVRNLFIKT